jgi:hypothetical protein
VVQANKLAALSTARNTKYLGLIAMDYLERLRFLKNLGIQASTLALRIVTVRSASVSASSGSWVT